MNSRILLILKYLWENTDENNTVSIAELIQYLGNNGLSADRKTVSKYIDMLSEFGLNNMFTYTENCDIIVWHKIFERELSDRWRKKRSSILSLYMILFLYI